MSIFLPLRSNTRKHQPCLHPVNTPLSAGHRWVLERVLPLQHRQGELSAVVHIQSTLQITAKRLQGCPSCGVQCALHSKSASCHRGGKGYFLGERRLPRAPRTEEEHQGVAIRVNCFDVQ